MQTKVCTKCGEEKPATNEYFSKCKTGINGLRADCKTCRKLYKKQWNINNKDKIKQYLISNTDKINQYKQINKDKISKYKKQWYEENKNKIKESHKRRKNEIKEYDKLYSKTERNKNYRKQYRKANKSKINLNCQKRRARKKQLQNNYKVDNWNLCLVLFNNQCCYCGNETSLEQEHFVPLSRGGEYTINNIVPACKSCNSSKGNKDFFEWYPKQEFHNKKREQKILKYLNYDMKTKVQQLALSI